MVSSCSHSTGQHSAHINTSGPSSSTATKEAKTESQEDSKKLGEAEKHMQIAMEFAKTLSPESKSAFQKSTENQSIGVIR